MSDSILNNGKHKRNVNERNDINDKYNVKKNKSGKLKNFRQFIKFALVGVSNTAVSEGVYAVLVFFKLHYLPASFIGFSLSVVNAYFWSSRYVFNELEGTEKQAWWKTFLKTYTAYLGGYAVNAVLLVLWIDILGIAKLMTPLEIFCLSHGFESMNAVFWGNLAAAAINLAITMPMNFLLNKYWAYRNKNK
jgi:putative flippase GtrA